ncbi:MAG: peptidoglycan D,D-transpeptidase FtsI family protein [Stenotrophobium sp.]
MSGARANLVANAVHPWRRWCVAGVMALGALVVLGRAFQLQVLERNFLRQEGDKRQIRTLVIPGHRGAIRDRLGEPLALSAPVEMIWAVPGTLLESPQYVYAVAKLLNRKPRELEQYLQEREERKFVYLSDPISPADAQRILSLKAPGVFSEPSYARYYPAGEVASQLVGFCGRDGNGLAGMERAQEATLEGKAGSRTVIRDRAGHVVEDDLGSVDAQSGKDLELSIDLRIQYLAYRELKAAVAQNQASGGVVVVADSSTGDILAMASQPGFNPNNMEDRKGGGERNRVVTDSFEPGSTIKPLLIAQALQLGLFQPTSLVDTTPGYFKVGALTVRDEHPQGDIGLMQILTKSSNVGAAKIGLTLGAQAVWSGYERFGLGDPVYSGLPGEATPVLRNYTEWGQIATATASYGYGLSFTALNLVRAYSALANDGLMPQLRLIETAPRVPPQRTVSAQVAREVRQLMAGVVAPGGTAARAAVPGYRIAGKTGTARLISAGGGYSAHSHRGIFIGMLPAEHPRLVGLVIIDAPSNGEYYGGDVSAPVFSAVMQGAARLLRIPPDEPVPAPAMPAVQTVSLPPREGPRT